MEVCGLLRSDEAKSDIHVLFLDPKEEVELVKSILVKIER